MNVFLSAFIIVSLLGIGCSGPSSPGGNESNSNANPASVTDLEIETSRTSGVAPLAIFFKMAPPAGFNTTLFHELHYEWTFGDPGSGQWAISGRNRNEDIGPLAGHLYTEPGVYTANVKVYNAQGLAHERSVNITVSDPDVVFSGQNTICFSTSGNFSGAPAGALQVTTSDIADIQGYIASGKRLLLRRGESWDMASDIAINVVGPGLIGAFGTGEAPELRLTNDDTGFQLSSRDPEIYDWRILDLEIDGLSGPNTFGIKANGRANGVLMYRLNIHHVHVGVSFPRSILSFWINAGHPEHTLHDDVALIDTSINDIVLGPNSSRSGGNGAYMAAQQFLFMGNHIEDTTNGEHVMRNPWVQDGVFAHSNLANPAVTKNVLKLHAPSFHSSVNPGEYTERVFIAYNTFRGGDNDWTATPGPQNHTSDERVRDIIFDSNHFISGVGTRRAITVYAHDTTIRNNVFDMTGGASHQCISVGQRGDEPASARVYIYHNTCYSADPDGLTLVTTLNDQASDVEVTNNLIAGPQSSSLQAVSSNISTLTEQSNIETATPGFVNASPSSIDDFQLSTSSPALDVSGAPLRWWRDLNNDHRPIDGNGSGDAEVDAGAFEKR